LPARRGLFCGVPDRTPETSPLECRPFNRAAGINGDVGVWHETHVVSAGTYENIYVNMPPLGLGKVGTLSVASAVLQAVDARLEASGRAP